MAAPALSKFLGGITPAPVEIPEAYDGWEFRWKFLVFRPAYFQPEVYLLFALLFYVAFYWWGSSTNSAKVKNWLSAHFSLYEQQFSNPSLKGLTRDGHSDFFIFSTGRRHIDSLHTIFTLRPRHDLVQLFFQTARTLVELAYRPMDDLQLNFKLAPGTLNDNFVFAIVAKDELSSIKDSRWDLSFTKTTENSALPPTLSVMSEYADITENLLTKSLGAFRFVDALQDPKILPFFRSLSITDQPRTRPMYSTLPERREKHLILSLHLPSASSDIDGTLALISSIFQLIDSLHKLSLRPETKSKLKKTREELDRMLKVESEKERKEEEIEAKAAKKKKADEERISKLSASEQRKELENKRKRQVRKMRQVAKK